MGNKPNTISYLPGTAGTEGENNAALHTGGELADVFAGADVGLALFDADLVLLACNPLYRQLCGYLTTEAASGRSLQELMEITFRRQNVPEDEIESRISRIVTSLEPGASYTFRYASPSAQVVEVRRRRLPNGTIVETVRQVEAQSPEMDLNTQFEMIAEKSRSRLSQRTTIKQRLKDGRVIAVLNEPMPDGGTIATYQDITEIELTTEKMVEYTRKLERSNRELVDFAYVASHDLQEPLRKIEAFGDRLVKKYLSVLPEEGQMFVNRMQSAASRMRQLINDLLSYSRVTTAANPFAKVSLKDVMSGVLSDLQIRIEETNATVEVADLPVIEADSLQMRQLFQNLIGNALKFRKEGVDPAVKISVEPADPSALEIPGPAVTITVSDNGIGFDQQFKEQIFVIFQRLHSRSEYEGTGIGLATCRKIVERHQGLIDAIGVPGEGSTFKITVPISQNNKEYAA